MSIKIASMNFGDCDTILHNTPNGMKNIAEVLGPNGEVYWSATKELTGIPPLSIRSNGTMLLDYLISGNMSQTGTPTSSDPIQPQECGERTGNLFASVWERGNINGTTGQNEVAGTSVRTKDYIPIKPNTAYSFNRDIANGYMNVRLYRADKSYIGAGTTSAIRLISGTSPGNPMGNNTSFCCFEVIDGEAAYIRFNDASNNTATKWLMVEGEYTWQTMPDYEPYGYKIPISSANTTTPIYLGEVPTTRRIKKLVLTGKETSYMSIDISKNIFSIRGVFNQATELLQVGGFCTHYKYNNAISSLARNMSNGDFVLNKIADDYSFTIRDNSFSNNTDFNQYVQQQYAAGTPVTVWYVLETEETGIVNEPIRKVGDYADTISMEQAGVQIPTNRGNTVIDVLTELKPSQMYIKYK